MGGSVESGKGGATRKGWRLGEHTQPASGEAHLHPLTCRHFMILGQRDRAPGGARERTLIVDVDEDRRSGDPIDPLSAIYAICILRMYTSWP